MTNISVQMKASYVPLNSQVKSFIVNKIDMNFFCVVQNNFILLETFSIMTLMVNGKPEDVMDHSGPVCSLQFTLEALKL